MKLKIIFLFLLQFAVIISVSAQCPTTERSSSSEIIIDFITHSQWSQQRSEVGLSNATLEELNKVEGIEYQDECEELNAASLSLMNRYDVFYYKVKDRFVVISVLKKPSDPDVISTGLTYLEVYNESFERLAGFSH